MMDCNSVEGNLPLRMELLAAAAAAAVAKGENCARVLERV